MTKIENLHGRIAGFYVKTGKVHVHNGKVIKETGEYVVIADFNREGRLFKYKKTSIIAVKCG